MTTDALFDLITAHGSLLALSRHLLGEEWSRARYQTLLRQVSDGQLTGWVAATVAAHVRIAELEAAIENIRTFSAAGE